MWGATGYTGRLLAAAMAQSAPAGFRWALAGRDRVRLEALRRELGCDAEVLLAEAHDQVSLVALARRTRVVASTVGPYAQHGTKLVAACLEAGSDYADLTGEVLWMRRCVDAFDAPARANGVRLVHACGFDSVPSDLGLWLLQRTALERHGRPCRRVMHVFGPMSGGVSGGTVASGMTLLAEAADDPGARRALADPDLLVPGAAPSPHAREPWWPQRAPGLGHWTAPFPMAAVNTRVVRRTRALLGEPWGHDVRYRERLRVPSWPLAALVGIGVSVVPLMLANGLLRRWLRRWLPRPGEGPQATALARGFFRTTVIGEVDGVRERVLVRVTSDLDPGYGATVRMLREVCMLLALGESDAAGGVLTPASLGAARLLERLDAAGIHVGVVPSEDGSASPRDAAAAHARAVG